MARMQLQGDTQIRPASTKVKPELHELLGQFLYEMVDFAIAAREELEANLEYYDALYEMDAQERDWPWPDASNFIVPFIPAQLDTLCARLTGAIFVERFFIVNGNTPEAAAHQFEVERYYNAELARHNWVKAFYECLHLALKDGTAVMEILWRKEVKTRRFEIEVPQEDEFGFPVLDENGEQKIETEVQEIPIEVYNDVELNSVRLRDFLLLPSWQTSIQESGAGNARMKMFSESDLRSMVKSKDNPHGWLWADAVEEVIARRSPGESDLNMSQQSIRDYRINGQIDISEDVSNDLPELPRQRGPFKCWLIFTDALDMDGDKEPEENVFLLHEESQECLGTMAFPYNHGLRPFVELTPIPRPGRFYGRSICELLRTVQEELNAIHNQRNDEISLRLSPPRYRKRGAVVNDQDGRWGPDTEFEVDDPQDVGILMLPDVPLSSWQEEQSLAQYGYMITGAQTPYTGQGQGNRKTKYEAQQQSFGQGVRLDLMAANIREFAKEVLWQIHHLKLQYGPQQLSTTANIGGTPQRLTIDKNVLAMDYEFGIAGMGGPLDKQQRMQEVMLTYSMLMQNPLVASNPMHVYAVTRLVLETIGVSDVQQFIGSSDEVQQNMQQQAQQAQQEQQFQQQLQMTLAQHGLSMPVAKNSQRHGSQRKSGGHSGAMPQLGGMNG